MTRAADRLIICGAEGVRGILKRCWYELIQNALDPYLVEEEENGEKVLRYRRPGTTTTEALAATASASEKSAPPPELPSWLRKSTPVRAPQPAPLSPSTAFEEEIARVASQAGTASERHKALQRGRVVHRLMQSLPDVPAARRQDAANRFLANAAAGLSALERAEIRRQVLAILSDASFAEMFAPGSRAEVPIVGRIDCAGADPVAISGQVDRLSVAEDAILIADYKSDGVVPACLDDVPKPYVAQLALYRALLTRLYPEKTVRAALLFTAGPRLIEVPGPTMDAAVARVLAESHSAVNVP